ncbi:hypothetical protein DPMN_049778 [Dreissena polymorpha]|uniref:Uncharacterized protein n=1 Tax=Dreissena polymorpha TaxID=45954 RepID=A0A9D4CGJ0_DREPO|nr:hypothetical protein DPMN_049778 [Dreissena polymorpha]
MSSLMMSSEKLFHPYAAAPMQRFYGDGRDGLFEKADRSTTADTVRRVQQVPEVVKAAENFRTSGETAHTFREVKTVKHPLPVPDASSCQGRAVREIERLLYK